MFFLYFNITILLLNILDWPKTGLIQLSWVGPTDDLATFSFFNIRSGLEPKPNLIGLS